MTSTMCKNFSELQVAYHYLIAFSQIRIRSAEHVSSKRLIQTQLWTLLRLELKIVLKPPRHFCRLHIIQPLLTYRISTLCSALSLSVISTASSSTQWQFNNWYIILKTVKIFNLIIGLLLDFPQLLGHVKTCRDL